MIRTWMPWALALGALLGSFDSSAQRYDAAAACGGLTDATSIQDVGVIALQARVQQGRCTLHVVAVDADALARQQRMLEAVSMAACKAAVEPQPSAQPLSLELRLPARCPLSSKTTLFPAASGNWKPGIPEYPATAVRDGLQGKVRLRALVNENGRVVAAVVRVASGHAVLDTAAAKGVRSWTMQRDVQQPALPAMSVMEVPVTFALNE
ncbi:TonB family protein [Stenotrophomonas lactitubi]|uniref:TonB family protein n=1 Tax=Stenotrophomonas lactitubi TaxID=2045214 RepID=UPI00289C8ED4|nr:TonB family protein [Stenotrophomonas lactitubi]